MEQKNDRLPGTRRFRIWVQGRLDDGFSEGLSGIDQEDVSPGTMLSGVLLDQSQVHSTLDLLRSLGIDVLRFEVDPPGSTDVGSDVVTHGDALRHHSHESTERPGVLNGGPDQENGR